MAAAQSGAYNYYHGFPTPGPQSPSTDDVFNHIFFASEGKWKQSRETTQFDYVVIGSGFCGYAFVKEIYKKWRKETKANPTLEIPAPKVLMLERGSFFLPSHVQNLPLAFANALPPSQRFMSETFPWTLSHKTITADQKCNWSHGMVPFIGGRSTLWSAWCPRPQAEFHELDKWPRYVTDMMTPAFFEKAEKLLNVHTPSGDKSPFQSMTYTPKQKVEANKKDKKDKDKAAPASGPSKVYSNLQKQVHQRLSDAVAAKKITSATRMQDAPMAIGAGDEVGIDFAKYSVVGPLLSLAKKYEKYFTIATNCAVHRIVQVDGLATALETSRGVLPLVVPPMDDASPTKTAKVILAVGCMPAATLLLNSFHPNPSAPRVKDHPIPGDTFSAHFITAVTARLPRKIFDGIGQFELGAIYLAGILNKDKINLQWHAQISVVSDVDPEGNKALALRYQPDQVACASEEQLIDSKDSVVFVFAVLGEIDIDNPDNFFRLMPNTGTSTDATSNCVLQFILNDRDNALWNTMDQAAFDGLTAIAGDQPQTLEFWDGGKKAWVGSGDDEAKRIKNFADCKFRVPGLVHESSLMPWREDEKKSCVDRNFKYQESKNVYVTGSSLWPTGASWNPTMTMVGFAQKLADNLYDDGHSSAKKKDDTQSSGATVATVPKAGNKSESDRTKSADSDRPKKSSSSKKHSSSSSSKKSGSSSSTKKADK